MCFDGSRKSLEGLEVIKSYLMHPSDKVYLISILNEGDNKDELTERLNQAISKLNIKVELILKEKENESPLVERLLREINSIEPFKLDFLVCSRVGTSNERGDSMRLGRMTEFMIKRCTANIILY